MSRRTRTNRNVSAGCFTCHGTRAVWFGGQAQGTAAQHHDNTGHPTWADVQMSVRYGDDAPGPALDREAIVEAVLTSDPDYQAAGKALDAAKRVTMPTLADLLRRR